MDLLSWTKCSQERVKHSFSYSVLSLTTGSGSSSTHLWSFLSFTRLQLGFTAYIATISTALKCSNLDVPGTYLVLHVNQLSRPQPNPRGWGSSALTWTRHKGSDTKANTSATTPWAPGSTAGCLLSQRESMAWSTSAAVQTERPEQSQGSHNFDLLFQNNWSASLTVLEAKGLAKFWSEVHFCVKTHSPSTSNPTPFNPWLEKLPPRLPASSARSALGQPSCRQQSERLHGKLVGPQQLGKRCCLRLKSAQKQLRPRAVLHSQDEPDCSRNVTREVIDICSEEYPPELRL